MADSQFSFKDERLKEIAADVLAQARAQGASAADTELTESIGQSVTVRQGEVETIEYTRDKGLAVTVYTGKQRGHASTSDLTPQAVRDTVTKALTIAKFTAADDCAGLADEDLLARDFPDLRLHHPWTLSVEQSIDMARACEAAAFAADKRVNNSEGATVGTHEAHFVYANSLGFMAGYPTSRHSISCAVIAGKDDDMQRDDWFTSSRDPARLDRPEDVGTLAGQRTARRLGARKIATTQVPVVFEAPLATGLLGHFVSAVSGGSLYRKSSFLVDSLGKQVFATDVTIAERPHEPCGLASTSFDEEGVATRERNVVERGMLQGYFLGSYSARKLGMRSTGNAGGNHNLIMAPGEHDLEGLLKQMGRGLLVTELLGMGVNMVTGDYSRGAAGFWVEDGRIVHPVQEITIASNLRDMFLGIRTVGRDTFVRGSRASGSVLIDRMTVAGD